MAPFYMEETEVTNHHYVMFLQMQRAKIKIKKGAVYGDDGIWLLLGPVSPGYEPIIYRDGEFTMSPVEAMNPVVRVTAKGARAFARFYGCQIPSLSEWLRAESSGEAGDLVAHPPDEGRPGLPNASESITVKRILSPVAESAPNSLGIRGLGANVDEWVVAQIEGGPEFHIISGKKGDPLPDRHIKRNSWEAFDDVGFRTVIRLPIPTKPN